MNSYHIHIGGLVQGVGFRPFVCRIAATMKIQGWVSNGNDGVHIECTTSNETAGMFYQTIISTAPCNAIIRSHHITTTDLKTFEGFVIHPSEDPVKLDVLLAPDIAICEHCRSEILDPANRRYQYPFTTCLQCGPRYSITHALPYDREHTSMAGLKMCRSCEAEYRDILNTRHHSQTNSCNKCSIPVHFYNNSGVEICNDFDCILIMLQKAFTDGHIVAVKGIGGYLLLCDASNAVTIKTLRSRKHRPAKPFAVLYPSVTMMEKDLVISQQERAALSGKTAPIVLCRLKAEPISGICSEAIAPALDKIGALLPYTPLLVLIMEQWGKPLIATSGNLGGAPIIYRDQDALLSLTDQADFILSFERDILLPQDDSVLQFTINQQLPVVLRRSRGLAPNYFPVPFRLPAAVLAMGADIKSAFALFDNDNLYVSQYLGDQGNYEAQLSYKATLHHLLGLLKSHPQQIIVDSHPGYFVSQAGFELAEIWNVPVTEVQHHKAHFAAVLAENELLHSDEAVLGVIWDGTGWGDDGQIWGGEFFLLEDGGMERYMHLDYFPQLLGDKMNKEPRVSAVSLLRNNMDHLMMVKDLFSVAEREYYLKLLQQKQTLLTSSMGRLLDGIAAILQIQSFNTYEGEAAIKLETVARSCPGDSLAYYAIPINKNRLEWQVMLEGIMVDLQENISNSTIARKVFVSLAMLIKNVAIRSGVKKIAFSGGVFQNVLLVDLLGDLLKDDFELLFHSRLAPNDECVGFGQLAYAALSIQTKPSYLEAFSITDR
jgi:hydrogenase maturation protein HypF